jgi:hypothetical protein
MLGNWEGIVCKVMNVEAFLLFIFYNKKIGKRLVIYSLILFTA